MKALLHESRQVTGVIDVCVCDQYGSQRSRIKRRLLPVAFTQLFQALKQTTVNEDARLTGLDQILRARDRSYTTPK
jgi:hypothetical protein